jgi:hypothetical protein
MFIPHILRYGLFGMLGIGACVTVGCTPEEPPADDRPEGCAEPDPGPSPIRRLTRVEYNNTVYQLLGDTSQPADAFPPDEEASGFDNQASALVVSPLLAEHYMTAAEALAAEHTPTLMAQLPACVGAGADQDACSADAQGFVESFGKRAFRRPLIESEVTTFVDLFEYGTTLGESTYAADVGVEMVVEAMLQSPHFLYRVEFGMPDPGDAGVVELTSWEVASRLSYLLWNTMPDEALFEAAEADELRTTAQIEAQARRMMGTPRAREAVKNFHRQWLGLDDVESRIAALGKNPEIYPDYAITLPYLWRKETEAFLDYAVFEENASVETLFTASYSMMNEDLAAFYGVSGPVGEEFVRVELDPNQYAGFLTHAGLLALHAKTDRSSPVHRGKFVRTTLMCEPPVAPPPNVPEPPEIDTSKTTREQFAEHVAAPECAGCHYTMDPVGFGFEHFDGIGRYRATENGLEIDASGEFIASLDIDGPFDGAVELANRLAGSEQVKSCVVAQWFRFGYGRVETEADSCSITQVEEAFAAANYDIKELVIALTMTDAFRYRRTLDYSEAP